MTSPPPLASLPNLQINRETGFDPGELLRSDFADGLERDSFPAVLSEERSSVSKSRRTEVESPAEAYQERSEEHDSQLNAAAHNAPVEKREVDPKDKTMQGPKRDRDGGEDQELTASEAERNTKADDTEALNEQEQAKPQPAADEGEERQFKATIAEEIALAQLALQAEDRGENTKAERNAEKQGAAVQATHSNALQSQELKAQAMTSNQEKNRSLRASESMDSRVDSRAQQIVDYLVENSTQKQRLDGKEQINVSAQAENTQASAVGERALAENLKSTRDLLQNLTTKDGTNKTRNTTPENQGQQRPAQSVNVSNPTLSENRLTNANMGAAASNAATIRTRSGSGAGAEQQSWDNMPGQTAWQGKVTGSKNDAGKQLPIAQQARNLMAQAAQTLNARQNTEGRRLSLTLPMEKHGPVRMILRPGNGGAHQMTFIANSATAAAALRRILPELEETASTFPVEVVDISIVTQENQATTQDSIGFSQAPASLGSSSNRV